MKRLLMYSDCPYAPTGFGVVSENIIRALQDDYQITLIAINHREDLKKLKVNIIHDREDNFSINLAKRMINRGGYDCLLIAYNPEMALLFHEDINSARKYDNIKYIHYAPIDTIHETPAQKVYKTIPDVRVYYNEFARNLLNDPEGKVINHGIDTNLFKPKDRSECRAKVGLKNGFIFLNINHNQWRKDLFKTVLAFAEFARGKNDVSLILHTNRHDMGGDLQEQIENAQIITGVDLSRKVQITNPNKWTYSREQLSNLYNAADCFVTTTKGEGWGLTTFEAMACGKPVIAPKISIFNSLPVGNFLYNANEWDLPYKETNTPYPVGRLDDIVQQFEKAYNGNVRRKDVGKKNRQAVMDWSVIRDQWRLLFSEI